MLGSSPRMRGALFWTGPGTQERRIIPADAGSTRLTTLEAIVKQGSSPRMRGAHARDNSRHYVRRIIPADAGSTTSTCRA